MLQVSEELLDPVQDLPPFIDVGLLQLLDLVLVPEPQVLEQLPQAPHDPQLPLRGPIKYTLIMNITVVVVYGVRFETALHWGQ